MITINLDIAGRARELAVYSKSLEAAAWYGKERVRLSVTNPMSGAKGWIVSTEKVTSLDLLILGIKS